MSTHLPGFQLFFRILASFCIGQSSHQQHKGLKGSEFVISELIKDLLCCTRCSIQLNYDRLTGSNKLTVDVLHFNPFISEDLLDKCCLNLHKEITLELSIA